MNGQQYRFQVAPHVVKEDLQEYIEQFVGELQSFFEVMPRGISFVPFEAFAVAYTVLSARTVQFSQITLETVLQAVEDDSLVLVVLRTILGFTPPELAHFTGRTAGIRVSQGDARRIDLMARKREPVLDGRSERTRAAVKGLVASAVALMRRGAPALASDFLHRLDQVDTAEGLAGVARAAREGVPYVRLLYERFLGRPFASHRDSVSERVGDVLEEAITKVLGDHGVPYYKSARAERFEDMDQAPDFFVPGPQDPCVVIEAKIAEDDGTARDKVTRIQHLAELRDQRERRGRPTFELVACVDGRGFGVRRGDVAKLLLATLGKVFTLVTVEHVIEFTRLKGLVGPKQP